MRRTAGNGKPSPMEELNRLQQDIGLLLQKVSELTNDSAPRTTAPGLPIASSTGGLRTSASATSVSSPFVSGLRGLAEQERSAASKAIQSSSPAGADAALSEKLTLLENILAKVTEFDRIILFKTNPLKEEGLFPVRRKSMKGGELYSLPAHFQLADRLMDLYNQSQRVVIVRDQTKAAPSSSSSGREGSLNLQGQGLGSEGGSDSTAALRRSEQEIVDLRSRLEAANKSLATAESKNKDSDAAEKAAAKKLKVTEDVVTKLEKRLMESDEAASTLAAKVKTLEETAGSTHAHTPPPNNSGSVARIRELEELLESERSVHEGIVSALLETASGVINGTRSNEQAASASAGVHLPEDVKKAMSFLLDSFRRSSSTIHKEKDDLQTAKTALEKQLSFMSKERDNANENLQTLAASHESLKQSFSEAGAQLLKMQEQKRTSAYSELEFERTTKLLADLQQEVSALRASSESTKTLEMRLHFIEEEKRQIQSANTFLKEDIKSANDMVEKLKQTLRTMSGKDEAFFDTFEGVMREEMMAMKTAFEAKLRAAKEEANALSRKHVEDIKKMNGDLSTPFGRARTMVTGTGSSTHSFPTTSGAPNSSTTGMGGYRPSIDTNLR